MAEFVQQVIEEMVVELHEMQTAGLFDAPEIRFVWLTVKSRGCVKSRCRRSLLALNICVIVSLIV